MALNVGDKAPDFTAKDTHGNTVSLASLAGKKFVLYFYPKDDTPAALKKPAPSATTGRLIRPRVLVSTA